MKNGSNTKHASRYFWLPFLYSAIWILHSIPLAVTGLLADHPETFLWIAMPSAIIAGILFLFMPLVYLVCITVSFVYRIRALRSGEANRKNYVMLAFSGLFLAGAALNAVLFVIGIIYG